MAITSLRALLFTVGGVVVVGGAAYVSGAFDKPAPAPAPTEAAASAPTAPEAVDTKTAAGTQQRIASAPAGQEQPSSAATPQAPATEAPATEAQAPAPGAGVVAPTFDVVRVEGDGSVVIAGKAGANAKVEIVHGSTVLGETTAGPDGAFAMVLDDPLKPGDYQIVLRSTAPDGLAATSEQTAVVSVPENAGGQVLAMVEEPGKPAAILTVPQPQAQQEAEAKPAGEQSAAAPAPASDDAQAAPQPAEAERPTASEMPAKSMAGPRIVVEAVEIDGSKVFVAGLANAGRKVRAYANDILLGEAVAAPDGHFLVEAQRDLPVGQYTVRVDALEADGKVAARATVPFDREPGEAMAAVAPQSAKQGEAGAAAANKPAGEAPAAGTTEAGVPEATAPKLEHADGAVIIRRGDSLWRISRRVYGHGIRYSTIYLANQKQIADPDKIWPGQVFAVPEKSTEGEDADLKALGDQATTVPPQ